MRRQPVNDLYRALGVSPTASAGELRSVFEQRRRHADPRSPAFARAAQAYAVLGDPRLRDEYDRGQTVGVGAGRYFDRGGPHTPDPARSRPACPDPPAGRGTRWLLATLALVGLAAMLVQTAQAPDIQALLGRGPADAAAPVPGLGGVAPAPQAPLLNGPQEAPGVVGTCLASDVQRTIEPGRTVACTSLHLFEVTSVIDLDKLLGRAAHAGDEPAAQQACSQAFTDYTGLPGPTPQIYPSGVTLLATRPATSWVLCLTGSHDWRTASSRDIAR